jgi:hypothetical protein
MQEQPRASGCWWADCLPCVCVGDGGHSAAAQRQRKREQAAELASSRQAMVFSAVYDRSQSPDEPTPPPASTSPLDSPPPWCALAARVEVEGAGGSLSASLRAPYEHSEGTETAAVDEETRSDTCPPSPRKAPQAAALGGQEAHSCTHSLG